MAGIDWASLPAAPTLGEEMNGLMAELYPSAAV